MKKILVLFCLICFSLPSFAYKPIPQAKRQEYNIEVQQVINNRYQSAIKQIDNDFIQAQLIYFNFLKNKNNGENYLAQLQNYDLIMDSAEFSLYYDVINITKKYVDISSEVPVTDWSGDLYAFLEPYFKNNNINTDNLYKISDYSSKKQKQINQYSEEIANYLYK